jgi:Caspase domain
VLDATDYALHEMVFSKGQRVTTSGEKLRIYATVVGLNDYEHGSNRSFGHLSYAERDAERVASFLRAGNSAFDAISVQLFIGTDARAERARQDFVTRLQSYRLTERDVILFYFAGHGLITPDNRAFLCCYSASPRDPTNDSLRLDDLYRDAQACVSDAGVMLVMDACFSGAIASPNIINQNAAQQMRALLNGTDLFGTGHRIILAAANENQGARENSTIDGGAGIFTAEVLRGWRDGAARGQDGAVSAQQLADYLQRQFGRNPSQQPVTQVKTTSLLTLGQFPPPLPGQPLIAPEPALPSRPIYNPDSPPVVYEKNKRKGASAGPKSGGPSTGQRRRIGIWAGSGLAVVAVCSLSTLISPALFNLWFVLAALVALGTLALAVRLPGLVSIPITFSTLAQAVVLVGIAHLRYGLGQGIGLLDGLAQYAWLAAVIFILQFLFLGFVLANVLWTDL